MAHVMSVVMVDHNRLYIESRKHDDGETWWNSFGTLIGSMFVGDEEKRKVLRLDEAVLLALYECIHLNRNFISTLTHAATEFTESPVVIVGPIRPPERALSTSSDRGGQLDTEVRNPVSTSSLSVSHPSNLLVVFLQTCSAVLQETRIEHKCVYDTIKLFMIVTVCITEDQFANSLLHDSNMVFSVFLHQAVSTDTGRPH
jgi:hypothetical protein